MRQSPIYNRIYNPSHKADDSFGSKGFSQEIVVGTSSKNSHSFAIIRVTSTRHEHIDKVLFRLWLDGHLIRVGELEDKEFNITRDINIIQQET